MFPIINHINDVLPAIAGRDEFVVGKRDGYQFIDYNYTQSDSFDCPIRRECRGLKFDLDGNLIARPLHKFFNLHEKPNEIPDLSQPHVVMEKLDGSMVHPVLIPNKDDIDGDIRWMTRAGITDQAKMAEQFASKDLNLMRFVVWVVVLGYTPIFEYTSPNNQIVVRYNEERLTLLAIRNNKTGDYTSYEGMKKIADDYGIPVVSTIDPITDLDAFVAHAKALKDEEGYVVRMESGYSFKMKADDYVLRHRARSNLLWEKDVLALVLENKVDDVIGMLPPDEGENLRKWAEGVSYRLAGLAIHCISFHHSKTLGAPISRKDYADEVNQKPAYMRPIMFAVYDGKPALEAVTTMAMKQTSSTAKARAFLDWLDVSPWTPTKVELDG